MVLSARFATTSDMLGLLVGLVFVVRGGCPLASTSAVRSAGLNDIRYVIYQRTASYFPTLRQTFVSALQQTGLYLRSNQRNSLICAIHSPFAQMQEAQSAS